jgi:hypothetical protein
MEEETKQAGSNQSGQKDLKGIIGQLETMLDEYMIKKAPFAIPQGGKDFIVNVSPYLIIIVAIMALPMIFIALGLAAVFAPFAMMGGYGVSGGWGFAGIVSLVATIATVIMELMAVPGLFKRTKGSWRLLFYASIVSLIGGILSFNGIIGAIIGAIIGWYILFQVKNMYKN